jgi:hypothetical protein
MGWERRGQHRYYIHKQRVHGRTVRRSLGHGATAIAAADADTRRRQVREAAQAERQHLTMLDQQLNEVAHLIERLVQATLLVAGYHQHHRSEWRKLYDSTSGPPGPAYPIPSDDYGASAEEI